jgi:predicted Zn-dependent protease
VICEPDGILLHFQKKALNTNVMGQETQRIAWVPFMRPAQPERPGAALPTQNIPESLARALELFDDDKFDEALREIDRVPKDMKGSLDFLRWKAAILVELERWEKALPLLKQACRLAPTDHWAFIFATLSLLHLREIHQAKRVLLETPLSFQRQTDFRLLLAAIEITLGNLSKAQELMRQVINLDRTIADAVLQDPAYQLIWPTVVETLARPKRQDL